MNSKHLIVTLALIAAVLLGTEGFAATRIITDALGRRVQVPEHVERVICSGSGCLRLLTYLQAQDKIVAVDDIERRRRRLDARPYALANPQFKTYPMFGEFRGHDHPELIRLTAFRDTTYTFATIAEEFYVPELRASVMNGYKRCASGKPKTMGIIDSSGLYAWDSKATFSFENFRLLHKHGVPMTTGNDTMPPCTPAMVGLELRMFDHILKGRPDGTQLSGAAAVKTATINSARSLGLENEFGSIESGKTADLVILDGDPLQDFRLIGSRVDALFMDGELVINNCGLRVESNVKA